jgi:acyl-CoA reductase-like NAD-dependent aldehyde dehydrogenase
MTFPRVLNNIMGEANVVSDKFLQNKLDVVPLWIDGSQVASSEGVAFPVYSAKDQKNVHMAQSASTEDVKAAADSAKRAFDSWSKTSAYERRELLLKAADAFDAQLERAIALQVAETSCEASWAGFNVKYGIRVVREIASRTTAVFGQMPRMNSDSNLVLVFKEPIGPSLLIAPLVEKHSTRRL